MTPKEFFKAYPTPYKKKGWPCDLRDYAETFSSMDEYWNAIRTPKHLVLILKTLNYAEEIWKWAIMKWGLECRDFSKRQSASEKCCDRIRRRVPVIKWH
jgi:hypothetical protein